jgi:hypothetical protein
MKHYVGISLVLVTIAAIVLAALYSCTAAADHTVASVRDAFASVFQLRPEITLNQRVVMTQTAPIAELAVVTKEELVTVGFTQNFTLDSYPIPLTAKTVSVEAVYRIKAGFDLRQPFHVTIDSTTHAVHATLPHAKILSVEQVGDLTYHGEDSVLNRITDPERQNILNSLNAAAHAQAEGSGLKLDAEKQASDRLQEIFRHNGQPIQTEWIDEPESKQS